MTAAQARQAVDVPVIVVIAAAFGLGAAVESSGLADAIAGLVETVAGPFGTVGLVVGLILLVVVLTELITNNAAAVLAFPVALATAERADLAARPLLLAVAVAASLSFVTPLGYQTNLMVYGLGGYRFGDFARLGVPVAVVSVLALSTAVFLQV
jgi:di/tricarboxylate transporter